MVIIYIHAPDGDMGEGIAIGPFSSWERAEDFRATHILPFDELEGILIPLFNQSKGLTQLILSPPRSNAT